MNESLWLTAEKIRLVSEILISYQEAFGKPLLACQNTANPSRTMSQEVFAMKTPLLAHDLSTDPLLIYANVEALQLWKRSWSEMIGLPSRLTAPEDQLKERDFHLNWALKDHSSQVYGGVRVNSEGRKFFIKNLRIWTIWNEHHISSGQAATFASSWLL